MSHDLPLLLALIAPIAILTLLGINAALVFLSLCLGQVLVLYVVPDALDLLGLFSAHVTPISKSTMQLAFLYAPAVLTAVLMIGTVRGKVRRLLNIVPAAGVGLLGVIMGVPLFTPALRRAIEHGTFWPQLSRAQAFVVGVTAMMSLFFLWTQNRSLGESHRHRRRS